MALPSPVSAAPLIAIGIDGAPAGWATACLFADVPQRDTSPVWRTELHAFASFPEVVSFREKHGGRATVAIDVPIGLLDTVDFRPCDDAARNLLNGRASCVFAPPARYMLEVSGDYAAIRALVEQRRSTDPDAKGLSAQAAGIAAKVAEVDRWVQQHRDSERWLFECHPELSFYVLAEGTVLPDKHSASGSVQRLELAAALFPDAPQRLSEAPWRHRDVGLSDLLDAYGALSTALRCASGAHDELGDGEPDGTGIRMRMAL